MNAAIKFESGVYNSENESGELLNQIQSVLSAIIYVTTARKYTQCAFSINYGCVNKKPFSR